MYFMFQAIMNVNVLKYKYKIHFKPHYIHDQLFEDVVLLSRDGKEFNLNVCIFASLSKLCRQLAEGCQKAASVCTLSCLTLSSTKL